MVASLAPEICQGDKGKETTGLAHREPQGSAWTLSSWWGWREPALGDARGNARLRVCLKQRCLCPDLRDGLCAMARSKGSSAVVEESLQSCLQRERHKEKENHS